MAAFLKLQGVDGESSEGERSFTWSIAENDADEGKDFVWNIAENTGDGSDAPEIFLARGGAGNDTVNVMEDGNQFDVASPGAEPVQGKLLGAVQPGTDAFVTPEMPPEIDFIF